ncbi:MAG: sugar ABC transporter permease [Candidatus Bipolaricaulota bacterium]|nr:sugar ABC transporter permease [Candidatus Bipolaricaulota bacterium]
MIGKTAQRQGRLFLAPTVILLLCFTIFPLLFTIALMFGEARFVGGGLRIEFVGGRNWVRLFGDERFWNALGVTVRIVAMAVSLEYLLGLGLALLLDRKLRGQAVFRVLFIVPMLLTPIAVGYMWRMIFDVGRGPITGILERLGLAPVGWLTESSVAIYSIVITDIWQWTPFMFLILYAALQAIPKDYIEAARVDGASGWQVFRRITLPLLAPASIAAVLLRTIECFKIVDTIYIMTGGGPGRSTESMTLFGYAIGFRAFDLDYGATISFSLFLAVLVSSMVFVTLTRRLREVRME